MDTLLMEEDLLTIGLVPFSVIAYEVGYAQKDFKECLLKLKTTPLEERIVVWKQHSFSKNSQKKLRN